jgi:hypothetical protein
MDKKFIKTTDKETADKLLKGGFKLVNEMSGVWTFMNSVPKNFNFDEVTKETYCYSNILSL